MDLLPVALLKLRVTPHSHGYSPYETVYGKHTSIVRQVLANLPQVRGDGISQQMEQLSKVINQVTKFVQERVPFPLGEQIHEFVPSDQVWVKDWKHDSLAPHWNGPYTAVLTIPTAVKVAGVTPWIHHMRMKRTCQADPENAVWTAHRDPTHPQETKIMLKKKKKKKIRDEPLQDETT